MTDRQPNRGQEKRRGEGGEQETGIFRKGRKQYKRLLTLTFNIKSFKISFKNTYLIKSQNNEKTF